MLPTVKARDPSDCNSDKRVSQWENIMRNFSRAHEEECRQTVLKMPLARRSTKYFPTGSQYSGNWNVLGMSGYGVYTYNNGVVYQGDFEDGMFHGLGQFRYPDGTVVRGHFDKGVMTSRKLIFSDGLVYEEEYWSYCKMPDRRYTSEYKEGIQPAGRSNITAVMPPREIPPGFYDTGDGVYDPKTKSVYKADDLSTVLRSPSVREQRWIIENCRTAPETVLGPREDLYEEWSVPQLILPRPPPAAADTQLLSFSSHQHRISTNVNDNSELWDLEKHNFRESQGFKPVSTANIDDKMSHPSILRSNLRSDVKYYNTRLMKDDSNLQFSSLSANYSELFSKTIDIAIAAVFQKATDATLKYSDVYDNTCNKNTNLASAKAMKDIIVPKIPNRNRGPSFIASPTPKECSDISTDSDDMLSVKFLLDDTKVLTRSRSYNKKKPEYIGLTSSVMMFKNADYTKLIGNEINISRSLSNLSEVEINNRKATRNTVFESMFKDTLNIK